MKSFLQKNWPQVLLAFLIPILIVFLAYFANGIYWNGPRTVLAGDAYHQYVGIHALYSRTLHENSGFLYTWTSGLGLNLYAFGSYYMGSFFMPLSFFFNVKNMPDALYLITLLKFGTIGLSSFISFANLYKKVNHWLVLSLAICFSLMSFLTSQIEIIMWLDVFILLPLIIWGLQVLIDEGKRVLYFASLAILFIQNYYFGFMIAIFLILYFSAQLFAEKWQWRKVLDFIITSLLAGITSLIMLLPMYLDLRANGQSFSRLQGFFTDHSWGLDLFAKNFVASYDTTQFGAVPMIYVGLLPLILALLFFFNKAISWKRKFGLGAILVLLIGSFYFNGLDLAWQGFHTPNMFLHRYSFLFSLMIILLAFESLSHWKEIKLRQVFSILSFLILGFSASYFSGHYKTYLHLSALLLTGLFLLAFFLLLFGLFKDYLPQKLFLLLTLLFCAVDLGVNTYYQFAGIKKEWVFPDRSYYNEKAGELSNIAKSVRKDSAGELVRTDNTDPDTANDGMKFGYNTISQFSSVRNSNSSAVMNDLGFQTDGLYLNLRYPGNSLLMDSIFGIKYNINQNQPSKFGFNGLPNQSNLLSVNDEAQSLGIFVPQSYHDISMQKDNPLINQTNFVNALSHQHYNLFNTIYSKEENVSGKLTDEAGHITLSKAANSAEILSISYQVTIPADQQAYIQVPNISYGNSNQTTMTITTPDNHYELATNNTGQFFNLGYYPKSRNILITLAFPNNSSVNFDFPTFWTMDINTYGKAMAKLKENPVVASSIKNGAAFSYNADKNGQLFLSIPYDKGWSATLDGKSVALEHAQQGFMKINAPAGKHHLILKFFPAGLKTGILAFILGISGFILYHYQMRRRQQRIEKNGKNEPTEK